MPNPTSDELLTRLATQMNLLLLLKATSTATVECLETAFSSVKLSQLLLKVGQE